MRFMFAAEKRHEVPKGTAKRWAHHTPDIKHLPEKAKHKDKEHDKKSFIVSFIVGCANAGVTNPQEVAILAEKFASDFSESVNKVGMNKQAISEWLGRRLGDLAVTGGFGSVILPATVGIGAGALAGKIHNLTEEDDAKTLRLLAERNEYNRRLAQAKTNLKVQDMLKGKPGDNNKYVELT